MLHQLASSILVEDIDLGILPASSRAKTVLCLVLQDCPTIEKLLRV